jgi:hypothetical protein
MVHERGNGNSGLVFVEKYGGIGLLFAELEHLPNLGIPILGLKAGHRPLAVFRVYGVDLYLYCVPSSRPLYDG